MSLLIKICGLSRDDAVTAAVDAGADALGFVFAESPRRVSPARAAALCAGLPTGVLRVAVCRHPRAADVSTLLSVFAPDRLQTDAEDFDALPAGGVAAWPVYRDTGAGRAALGARRHSATAPVVFEAADSGTGTRADWTVAAAFARRCPLILAGGLTPDNVAAAIAQVRPAGVDVSSGVESAPGIKDPARIRAFIDAARAAQNELPNGN